MNLSELSKRILSALFIIPLSLYFIIQGSIIFNIFIIIILIMTLIEWNRMTSKSYVYLSGCLFIFFSFYSVYIIRTNNELFGLSYFILVLIICIATDIGGFCFGKLFKGPKLTHISPNKTISGVVGSYIFSVIFIYILISLNSSYLIKINEVSLDFGFLILIFTISTISQIGDLTISYYKRAANLKDTGELIPGHGGILDRIDGMLFAFPFYYLLMILLK